MPDGLDPSIILGPSQQAQQNGPINALVAAAQTGNALYNFQKQGADLAAGQDFQKAIGPNGQVDPAAFNNLLAADPRAALAAIASSQAGQDNQSSQFKNQQTEIANTLDRLQAYSNLMASYAANPPTMKQAQSDFADGIAGGIYTPTMGATTLSEIPFDRPESVQKQFYLSEAQHKAAVAAQLKFLLPQPQTVDMGSGAQVVDANPITNSGIVGTQVQYGLTPAEQVTPGQINLPGGGAQVGTMPQLARAVGAPIPQGGVTPGGTQAPYGSFSAPIPQVNAGPGRIYAPGGGPGGAVPPGTISPSPSPNTPGAPSPIGLNIGAGTADIAKNDTDYFTSALGNQQAAAASLPALRNVLAAAPGAQTGPAAEDIATIGSALNEFGIDIGANQAEQVQNLTKNGVQLVAALANKLGTPTDSKMMEAALGSPNANLTEGAIRTIGAEMTGTATLANATANALQAARAQGIQPGTVQFAALRSALNNPMLGTAFQFPYLDPAARGRVIAALGGLKSPEAQQLLSQLNFAYQLEPQLPSIRGGK